MLIQFDYVQSLTSIEMVDGYSFNNFYGYTPSGPNDIFAPAVVSPRGLAFNASGFPGGVQRYFNEQLRFVSGCFTAGSNSGLYITLTSYDDVNHTSADVETFTVNNTSPIFHIFNAGPATRFALSAVSIDGSGTGSFAMGDLTLLTGAVPEPATWAMMIGGFGLTGGIMRRRVSKVSDAAA